MSIDNKAAYIKFGEALLNEHIELVPLGDLIAEAMQELDATDPKSVISFGYDFLDDKLTGLFPGELVVIGGESGTGKTTFATNIIYRASANTKCAIFALEDRIIDYGIKLVYFEIGRLRAKRGQKNYPWNAYRKNMLDNKEQFYKEREEAIRGLHNPNVYFEKVKKLMDIDMLDRALREQTEMGFQMFLIDHLHRFDMSTRGKDTKADYIETMMTKMKQMQNETGARILLIVHYKKLDGQKPSLDSFKDSISIVQNANYVINLWRDRAMTEDDERHYETKMFVPKSRNPNGEVSFDLIFDPDINDYQFKAVSFGTPLSSDLQQKYASF